MSRQLIFLALLASVVFTLAGCAGGETPQPLPLTHPSAAELEQQPLQCTGCHEARSETFNWQRFNHNAGFAQEHRFQANQQRQVCSLCHRESFCNDCHATRVELKPSLRQQSDTYRRMPHRGDYLSRHRIDGRVNPASCIRCHGNPQSAETCARCHG